MGKQKLNTQVLARFASPVMAIAILLLLVLWVTCLYVGGAE